MFAGRRALGDGDDFAFHASAIASPAAKSTFVRSGPGGGNEFSDGGCLGGCAILHFLGEPHERIAHRPLAVGFRREDLCKRLGIVDMHGRLIASNLRTCLLDTVGIRHDAGKERLIFLKLGDRLRDDPHFLARCRLSAEELAEHIPLGSVGLALEFGTSDVFDEGDRLRFVFWLEARYRLQGGELPVWVVRYYAADDGRLLVLDNLVEHEAKRLVGEPRQFKGLPPFGP